MAKFRKKPVVIDAFRFGAEDVPQWWTLAREQKRVREDVRGEYALIGTLEGTMQARVGDFIIRGVQGEIYPCKPDIFAATYEAVE